MSGLAELNSLGRESLTLNKRAVGRAKDLADLDALRTLGDLKS